MQPNVMHATEAPGIEWDITNKICRFSTEYLDFGSPPRLQEGTELSLTRTVFAGMKLISTETSVLFHSLCASVEPAVKFQKQTQTMRLKDR